jgi:hypothetical protein
MLAFIAIEDAISSAFDTKTRKYEYKRNKIITGSKIQNCHLDNLEIINPPR